MALYNNPYQYSFGVPGQMNQFQQQPVQNMDNKYVTRQEYDDLRGKYEAIINRLNSFSEPVRANTVQESAAKGGNADE